MAGRTVRGLVATLVAFAGFVVFAPPASANHTVVWGSGTNCEGPARSARTTVGREVPFIACVQIGGEPLPGHQMDIIVTSPSRTVEQSILTDNDGIARFRLQPTTSGTYTVALCDADGCVYGETVVTVDPAPTTTTVSTTRPPAVVAPTTTAPLSTTTSAPATTTTSTPVEVGPGAEIAIGEVPVVTAAATKKQEDFPWLIYIFILATSFLGLTLGGLRNVFGGRKCACVNLKAGLAALEEYGRNLEDLHNQVLEAIATFAGVAAAAVARAQAAVGAAAEKLAEWENYMAEAKDRLKGWRRNARIHEENARIWEAAEVAWAAYKAKCGTALAGLLALPSGGEGFIADTIRISRTPIPDWIEVFPKGIFWAKTEEAADALRRAAGALMRAEAIHQLQVEWDRASQQEAIASSHRKEEAESGKKAREIVPKIEYDLRNKDKMLATMRDDVTAAEKAVGDVQNNIKVHEAELASAHAQIDEMILANDREIEQTRKELAECEATVYPKACPDKGIAVVTLDWSLPTPEMTQDGVANTDEHPGELPPDPGTSAPAAPDNPPAEPPLPPDRAAPPAVPSVPAGTGAGPTKAPTTAPPASRPPPPPLPDPGKQSPLRRMLENAIEQARAWKEQLDKGTATREAHKAADDALERLLRLAAQLHAGGDIDAGSLVVVYDDLATTMRAVDYLRRSVEVNEAALEEKRQENQKAGSKPKWELRPAEAHLQSLRDQLAEQEAKLDQLRQRLDELSPIDQPASAGDAASSTSTSTGPAAAPAAAAPPVAGAAPGAPPSVPGGGVAAADGLAALDSRTRDVEQKLSEALAKGRLADVADLAGVLRELTVARQELLNSVTTGTRASDSPFPPVADPDVAPAPAAPTAPAAPPGATEGSTATRPPSVPTPQEQALLDGRAELDFWDGQIDDAARRLAVYAESGDATSAARTATAISEMQQIRAAVAREFNAELGVGTSAGPGFDPAAIPDAKIPEAAALARRVQVDEKAIRDLAGGIASALGSGRVEQLPALLNDLAAVAEDRFRALEGLKDLAGSGTSADAGAPRAEEPPPEPPLARADRLRSDIAQRDAAIGSLVQQLGTPAVAANPTRLAEISSEIQTQSRARDAIALRLVRLVGGRVPMIRYEGLDALGKIKPRVTGATEAPAKPPPPPPPPPAPLVAETAQTVAALRSRGQDIDRRMETLESAIARLLARGDADDIAPLVAEVARLGGRRAALAERYAEATGEELPKRRFERATGLPSVGTPAAPPPDDPTRTRTRAEAEAMRAEAAAAAPVSVAGLSTSEAALVEKAYRWADHRIHKGDRHAFVRALLEYSRLVGADRVHEVLDGLGTTSSSSIGVLTAVLDALIATAPTPAVRDALRLGQIGALEGISLDTELQGHFGTDAAEATALLTARIDQLVTDALRTDTVDSLLRAASSLARHPDLKERESKRAVEVRRRFDVRWKEYVAASDAEDRGLLTSGQLSSEELFSLGADAMAEGRFATAIDAFVASVPENAPLADQVRAASGILELLHEVHTAADMATREKLAPHIHRARALLRLRLDLDRKIERSHTRVVIGGLTGKALDAELAKLEDLAWLDALLESAGLTADAQLSELENRSATVAETRARLVNEIRNFPNDDEVRARQSQLAATRAIERGITAAWAQRVTLGEVRERLAVLDETINGRHTRSLGVRYAGLRGAADATEQAHIAATGGLLSRGGRAVANFAGVDSTTLDAAKVRSEVAQAELAHADGLRIVLMQARPEIDAVKELEQTRKREMAKWRAAQPDIAIRRFSDETMADRIQARLADTYRTEVAALAKSMARDADDVQSYFRLTAQLYDETLHLARQRFAADQDVPWYKFGFNSRSRARMDLDTIFAGFDSDREFALAMRAAASITVAQFRDLASGKVPSSSTEQLRRAYDLLVSKGYIRNGKYAIPEAQRFTGQTSLDAYRSKQWLWTDELFSAESIVKMTLSGAFAARIGASIATLGWSSLRMAFVNAATGTASFSFARRGNPLDAVPIPGRNAEAWFEEYALNLATAGLGHGLRSAAVGAGAKLLDPLALKGGLDKWAWQMTSGELRSATGATALHISAKAVEYSALAGWERFTEWSTGRPMTPFLELVAKNAFMSSYLEAVSARAAGGPPAAFRAHVIQEAARFKAAAEAAAARGADTGTIPIAEAAARAAAAIERSGLPPALLDPLARGVIDGDCWAGVDMLVSAARERGFEAAFHPVPLPPGAHPRPVDHVMATIDVGGRRLVVDTVPGYWRAQLAADPQLGPFLDARLPGTSKRLVDGPAVFTWEEYGVIFVGARRAAPLAPLGPPVTAAGERATSTVSHDAPAPAPDTTALPTERRTQIEQIRERAGAEYQREIDRLLDNSRFRAALDDVRDRGTSRSDSYRRAIHDLEHAASGEHGPVDLPVAAERLFVRSTDADYREALADVQSRALAADLPASLHEHDRAQLDQRAEEIRRAAGSVDVSSVLAGFAARIGPVTPARWREILGNESRKAELLAGLQSPDAGVRRTTAVRFLFEAGSWQRIKSGVHDEHPDVAARLFAIRSELAEQIMRDHQANLIGTVKSMQNDADYNFKLTVGADGRTNDPIGNMLRATEAMERVISDALGPASGARWELIWESNFYLDPTILHLHTTLPDPAARASAWRRLTGDSIGLFLELLDRMAVPQVELDRYRRLVTEHGLDPAVLPTQASLARSVGLQNFTGIEGRREILTALRDALNAFTAVDGTGTPTGATMANALRVVRLNMLLNLETEGAYVPPGAAYITVTVKEGSQNPLTKPFKADLARVKVPEEHAAAVRRVLAELDRLQDDGLDTTTRIAKVRDELAVLGRRAIEESNLTHEIARRQAAIAELERSDPNASDLPRLRREVELLLTPGGFQRFAEYLKQELESLRLRDIIATGRDQPEAALQSVLGDLHFYFHILQGARHEPFWGTQRYELFKYASRVLEIARALRLEHDYLPIRRYADRAARIYEDHTPAEQFPGDPFSRADDFVAFERAMRMLQADIVKQLLHRSRVEVDTDQPTTVLDPVDFQHGSRTLNDPDMLGRSAIQDANAIRRIGEESDFEDLVDQVEANRQALRSLGRLGVDVDAIARNHNLDLRRSAESQLTPLDPTSRDVLSDLFEIAVDDALAAQVARDGLIFVDPFVGPPPDPESNRPSVRPHNPDYLLIVRAVIRGRAMEANPLEADLADYAEVVAHLRDRLRDPAFVAMLERGVVRHAVDGVQLRPLASEDDRALLLRMAGVIHGAPAP